MSQPYYIQVLGSRGSIKPHFTIESARTEAARLHAFFNGTRTVRIVETLEDIDASHVEVVTGVKVIPRIMFKKKRQLQAA